MPGPLPTLNSINGAVPLVPSRYVVLGGKSQAFSESIRVRGAGGPWYSAIANFCDDDECGVPAGTVIENTNEKHLNKAIWLFPLYMLAINIFVLPIAFGGGLHFPLGRVDADTFVLTVPMAEKQEGLALLAFIG